MEDLVCTFVDYECTGFAEILNWGDNESVVKMDPFYIDSLDQLTEDKFNDGGFGCQRIKFVHLYINARYTFGAKKFIEERWINLIDKDKEVSEKNKDEMEIAETEIW